MTFCSKSDDLELPRVGEVWLHTDRDVHFLVVRTFVDRWPVAVILPLEGREAGQPFEASAHVMARNNRWKRFASP